MVGSHATAAAPRAAIDVSDARVLAAEEGLRLAAEEYAARIQRSISSNVNVVMSVRPATSFKVRNAIQAAQNSVNSTSRLLRPKFQELLTDVIDRLVADGVPLGDVSRLHDQFDDEIEEQLRTLTSQGITDLASLIRNGRRSNSVRGTLVGRYELFVSQPENGRGPVKLGEVSLGDSQMIRGLISTDAAAEFFLGPIEGPTPLIALPPATPIKAVRWLYRGAPLVVTADDSRTSTLVPVDGQNIVIRGVDLLPERLRIVLERRLEGTPDITTNIDGADGFFKSVTYVLHRLPDEP
jgi:hypothetical protein